ncbi:MAG: hypothetical protein AB1760_00405 [Pseudomonadota bacterium]
MNYNAWDYWYNHLVAELWWRNVISLLVVSIGADNPIPAELSAARPIIEKIRTPSELLAVIEYAKNRKEES